jgi:glycosyltransferase involved in cell wall biosynthesis
MAIKMNNPLVSVLMATYQGDDFTNLKIAINSILNQTYKNFELLIIVDGPIDQAREGYLAILSYANNIKIFRNSENCGPAFSRNIGINAAAGDYVAIMDADDFSIPERLQHQINYIRDNELDIISSFLAVIDDRGELFAVREVPVSYAEVMKLAPLRCPLHNPSAFGKTLVFKKLQYNNNLRVSEDYDLWVRALLNGFKLGNTILPCVKYRQSHLSISKRIGIKYAISDLKVKWKSLPLCPFYLKPAVLGLAIVVSLIRLLPKNAFAVIYKLRYK